MAPDATALEQAFLDDIVAHPDDPSLWLILADWLDERDDPRSELVRLTWQLQYEPEHGDFAKRQKRVQALLAGGMVPVRPRRNLEGFEFAWAPPGSFLMGSPKKERSRSNNEAQHRVTLTASFWIGAHTVTQGQWVSLMDTNPSHNSRTRGTGAVRGLAEEDLARLPVESVGWHEVMEFCTRLSERLGRRVGLPTEAQWEYACRAGTTTPYHFGATLNETQATCTAGSLDRTTVVGSYPPNAWGVYDMHGNVWEWCADAYDGDYEKLPAIDPFRLGDRHASRAIRGGSWCHDANMARAAFRAGFSPEGPNSIGFRLVLLP